MDPIVRAALNRVVVMTDLAAQNWKLVTDVLTAYQGVAQATLDAVRALVDAVSAADAGARSTRLDG